MRRNPSITKAHFPIHPAQTTATLACPTVFTRGRTSLLSPEEDTVKEKEHGGIQAASRKRRNLRQETLCSGKEKER
jgi:hypothetical protein